MFINLTHSLNNMKSIYETFTDEEFLKLKKRKGKLSWHDFILLLLQGGIKK